MVSVREIRRMFENIAPERQLPMTAIIEFQTRAETILYNFVKVCNLEAGGEESNTRLTCNHVKLAYVDFSDRIVERKEESLVEQDEEFGEWNEEGEEE